MAIHDRKHMLLKR